MTTSGTDLLGGAAIIGVIAACWGHVKYWASQVVRLLIVSIHINGETAHGFIIYSNNNLKRWSLGQRSFGSRYRYLKRARKYQYIVDEKVNLAEPVVLWEGWKPISMTSPDPKELKEIGELNNKDNQLTLKFIRGTWDIDDILRKSIDTYNSTMQADRSKDSKLKYRFFTCRFVGSGNKSLTSEEYSTRTSQTCTLLIDAQARFPHWKHEEIGIEPNPPISALDNLFLSPDTYALVKEISRWKDSKDWYLNKNIPWQRGWLLYGPPGNGKTSLVRAIGQDLDLPIVSYDLSSMNNTELVKFWKQGIGHSPCIMLFEDIDAVFHGRENITGLQGGGITFDCFLNCLNGVEPNNGVFIVITTNYVEHVDPAIGQPTNIQSNASRPGRIDKAIELKNPDANGRRQIAEKILKEWPGEINKIISNMDDSHSAAQVQEKCIQHALSLYWQDWHPPLKLVG